MAEDLVLVGASGLAREVISALTGSEAYRVVGVVDDDPRLVGTAVGGVEVLGPIDRLSSLLDVRLAICVGRGRTRAKLVKRLGEVGVGAHRYATVVGATVRVPASCSVGRGSILLGHSILTADVRVGQHVVLMPNVTLTHDDRIDDFATLCAGVSLGGSVSVGSAAYLGMNASVRENLSVGSEATLGMGSALLEDQPARTTWAGVPARPLRTQRTDHDPYSIEESPRSPENLRAESFRS